MNAIQWLKEIPARNGQREFLIDSITGRRLTFEEIHRSACAVAADLQRKGLRKGDRLTIILHNSAEFVKLYFGCLYAGVVTVPINPALGQKEIDFIVKHCGAKYLVASSETIGQLDSKLWPEAGLKVLLLNDGRSQQVAAPAGAEAWDLTRLPDDPKFEPFKDVSSEDTMTIVYTSGTTAQPSGVVHRIADVIGNAMVFNRRVGINKENRFYGVLAMTYLGGYYNLLLLPYVAESSVVLSDAFGAKSVLNFWGPAKEHGVNTLWMVPTIMAILMEMDRGHDGEDFCRQNVRLGLVGTAPLPVPLRQGFEKRYGFTLRENYGLSETFFIATNAPSLPLLDGCVGRIVPGVEVTITDDEGHALPYGQEGEIRVCTPHLMEGYYNPLLKKPDILSREDWFPTGDIGVLSGAGDLFITGRKKDLIIRGGVNISPASIENVLSRHSAVAECAVVGVPHALYGEEIAAVVKLKSGMKFTEVQGELIQLCKDSLGPGKQPSQILEMEEFPKSSSGKIQKGKIRDLLTHKLGLAHLIVNKSPARVSSPKAAVAMIPGRVRRVITRPPAAQVEELRQFPVSIVSDCLNRMGVMDSAMRPLSPGKRFCGPAVTVEEAEGHNIMSHLALDYVQPGDVLVIDGKGSRTRSSWGGLQAKKALAMGLSGVVVNGTVRDYQEIVESKLPLFCLGVSPAGPLKGWGGNINCPIACAGVSVQPGDIVMGDDDGVVVVPRELAPLLPAHCRERMNREKGWFEKLKPEASTLDIVDLRQALERTGVVFE